MKLLADMGVSPITVAFLRDLGHDAVHLHERSLDRATDHAVLELASQEQRIVLTHDLDFAELMAASGDRLPSVVILRLRSMKPGNVNLYLETSLGDHGEALARGAIISIAEGLIRVRELPVKRD